MEIELKDIEVCHYLPVSKNTKVKLKNELYNTYINNGYKGSDYIMLQEAINNFSKTISKKKEEYHYHLASKLNNPSTSVKTYWPIL